MTTSSRRPPPALRRMCEWTFSHTPPRNAPAHGCPPAISSAWRAVLAPLTRSASAGAAPDPSASRARNAVSTFEPFTCVWAAPAAIFASLPMNPATTASSTPFFAHCSTAYPAKSPICT